MYGVVIVLYVYVVQLFYDDVGKVEVIKRIVEALRSVRDAGAFIGVRVIGNLVVDVCEVVIVMFGELKFKVLIGVDIVE